MDIFLKNSLTKKKELFEPLKKGEITMYSCGPTVYHYVHIGNLRSFMLADILKRTFLFNGYKVKHIMNITDVGHLSDEDTGEDRFAKSAKKEKKSVWDIAEFYTKAFLDDMKHMNFLPPTRMTKATDHIKEMIVMIKKLEKNGHTYIANGNVYFDTSTFKGYGALAHQTVNDETAQARVEKDPHKKNYADFVLWFTRYKYDNHAMQWDSPWGKGFPGWHIECSAMATTYLGDTFDVHTGGADLAPIHHTNEIAQSEASSKKSFVNYWLHNEFLIDNEKRKMSRSKGDILRLQTLIDKGFTAQEYRYLVLGTQYRKPLEFSWEALQGAQNTLKRLYDRVIDLKSAKGTPTKKSVTKWVDLFQKQINNDLNTPNALAVLWKMLSSDVSDATKNVLLFRFDEVLGLNLKAIKPEKIPAEVLKFVKERERARKRKDWKMSDKFRTKIEKAGYTIRDTKDSAIVRKS